MTRRMMACLFRARQNGTLPEQFRAAGARSACPRWGCVMGNIPPQTPLGNPGDNTVHFLRVAPGLCRLVNDVQTPD